MNAFSSRLGRIHNVQSNARKKNQKTEFESKVLLTAGETAHLLGIHVNTVRRWSQQGRLRTCRICSRGDRRFRREDVDRFLEEREIRGGSNADKR